LKKDVEGGLVKERVAVEAVADPREVVLLPVPFLLWREKGWWQVTAWMVVGSTSQPLL
jgi:hypothetical protein